MREQTITTCAILGNFSHFVWTKNATMRHKRLNLKSRKCAHIRALMFGLARANFWSSLQCSWSWDNKGLQCLVKTNVTARPPIYHTFSISVCVVAIIYDDLYIHLHCRTDLSQMVRSLGIKLMSCLFSLWTYVISRGWVGSPCRRRTKSIAGLTYRSRTLQRR